MEMKHYSQHLLRMKTTSALTTGAPGGKLTTGKHVLDVFPAEVEQGVAPGEQFIPLRNPTGSREFLELRARRGGAPPPGAPENAVQLSQVFPQQTLLTHHAMHFDAALPAGERERSAGEREWRRRGREAQERECGAGESERCRRSSRRSAPARSMFSINEHDDDG
jgi:hypothetical protein